MGCFIRTSSSAACSEQRVGTDLNRPCGAAGDAQAVQITCAGERWLYGEYKPPKSLHAYQETR